jgi:hypothetical protein
MEDFAPYELAVKLKEKGFKEKCYAYYFPTNHELCYNINQLRGGILYDCLYSYNSFPKEVVTSDFIDAPTISQVLKWLREKKGWIIVVRLYSTNGWYWFIQDEKGELKSSYLASCDDCFQTYELAALAGVEYCLDNLI